MRSGGRRDAIEALGGAAVVMPVEIDTRELEAEFENISRDVAEEAAGRWFSKSQEYLYEGGDTFDYEVQSVAQAASPPQWDDSEGGFRFSYFHKAALFFEDGTTHDEPITPNQASVLSFVWSIEHDPPQWVRDEFEREGDGWRVFLPKTQPEGIEAIDYMKKGRDDAKRFLEGQA